MNNSYNIQGNYRINKADTVERNNLYILREDLIPYSFGGNKARKALLFFEAIDRDGYDCVVTYGSSSSNHCRVVANMAAARKLPCYIISPEESSKPTFNSEMMELFGAEIIVCPVSNVRHTIDKKLEELKKAGVIPYFIAGGGHGNIGTQAYVNCYREIMEYSSETGVKFDYIFHASGTGTTQAGLVCGKLMSGSDCNVVGISIARKKDYGKRIVLDSVYSYLEAVNRFDLMEKIDNAVIFEDAYIDEGYGVTNASIRNVIANMLIQYGIPLDGTYTGKAFWGMQDYLKKHNIQNKNVLFIHTGGTPLFFDNLLEQRDT